jgi:NAD(P)-dependent dehydrogenase (short-subunit alcohol dehydrogenase family)
MNLMGATATQTGQGITVNFASPVLIATQATQDGEYGESLFANIVAQQCVQRTGLSRDVAHAITYVVSPEADLITDQMFDVGGSVSTQSRLGRAENHHDCDPI